MFTVTRSSIEQRFVKLFHEQAPVYVKDQTLSISSRTLTRLEGSFIDDGVEPKNFLMIAGLGQVSNNNVFEIEEVSDLSITLKDPNDQLVDEVGSGDESYSYPSYPICFENSGFKVPDADQTYITCFDVHGRGQQITIGDNPWYRYQGFVQNSIYGPEGAGTADVGVLAERIAKIWRRAQFVLGDLGQITFDTPSLQPVNYRASSKLGSKDGRYRIDVTTEYYADVKF